MDIFKKEERRLKEKLLLENEEGTERRKVEADQKRKRRMIERIKQKKGNYKKEKETSYDYHT